MKGKQFPKERDSLSVANRYTTRILIITDDMDRSTAYRRSLQARGFETTFVAQSTFEAIDKGKKGACDLVICDVSKNEDHEGWSILEQLGNRFPTLAIIATIDDRNTDLALTCIRNGALDCFIQSSPTQFLIPIVEFAADRLSNAYQKSVEATEWRDVDTGLHRRQKLHSDLHNSILQVSNTRFVALLLIDIDDFKSINQLKGYEYGTKVLRNIAQRIQDIPELNDKIYRWGDDELAIILESIYSESEAIYFAREIQSKIETEMKEVLDGIDITLSIGLAVTKDKKAPADDLSRKADLALDDAKQNGKRQLRSYSKLSKSKRKGSHLGLGGRLKRAIENGAIDTYFQPLIDMRTGHPTRIEALSRWVDGDAGPVSPDVFVEVADDLGLVNDLCELVLIRSIVAVQTLRKLGFEIACSINVSRKQLNDIRIVDSFSRLVRNYDEPPSNITLEITETSTYSDEAVALEIMLGLRKAGFILAVDDFGTGHSTLSQLSSNPFNELKIDRSITSGITSPNGFSIVHSIVSMARRLNMTIVAEGIEDDQQASLHRSLGVDFCQGYYFGHPMPIDSLIEYLGPQPATV